jgi:hypothetical protein
MTKIKMMVAALSLVAFVGAASAATPAAPQYSTTHKMVVKPVAMTSVMVKKHKKLMCHVAGHKDAKCHVTMMKAPAKKKIVKY